MKRMNLPKVCNTVSILLLLGFAIHTVVDYYRYYHTNTLNSAPFYLWVVVNAVYFIIPAIISLIVGVVVKRKAKEVR